MYAYVDDNELPKQLAEGEVKEEPKKLVDHANATSGHDNITAVVVRIGETSSTELAPRTSEIALKLEVLKGMQMFRYLSYKELVQGRAIAEMLELKTAEQGDLQQGPARRRDVRRARRQRGLAKDDTTVAEIGRGHRFGEMSLVDRSVRSLTATAAEGARLVSSTARISTR